MASHLYQLPQLYIYMCVCVCVCVCVYIYIYIYICIIEYQSSFIVISVKQPIINPGFSYILLYFILMLYKEDTCNLSILYIIAF